jgi:hypothetical protein
MSSNMAPYWAGNVEPPRDEFVTSRRRAMASGWGTATVRRARVASRAREQEVYMLLKGQVQAYWTQAWGKQAGSYMRTSIEDEVALRSISPSLPTIARALFLLAVVTSRRSATTSLFGVAIMLVRLVKERGSQPRSCRSYNEAG